MTRVALNAQGTRPHPNKDYPKINARIIPGCDMQLAQVSTYVHPH